MCGKLNLKSLVNNIINKLSSADGGAGRIKIFSFENGKTSTQVFNDMVAFFCNFIRKDQASLLEKRVSRINHGRHVKKYLKKLGFLTVSCQFIHSVMPFDVNSYTKFIAMHPLNTKNKTNLNINFLSLLVSQKGAE